MIELEVNTEKNTVMRAVKGLLCCYANKVMRQSSAALIIVMSLAMGITSCSDDNDDLKRAEKLSSEIYISTVDFTVDCNENEFSFSFSASDSWIATSNVSWIKVLSTKGAAGNATIKVSIEQNTMYDQRNGSITVRTNKESKTITITQKQLTALIVTSNKIEVGAEGGASTIEVKTNVSFDVIIDEACESWISVASTKSISTHNVVLQIAKNDGLEKRIGVVRIASGDKHEDVFIYQQGGEPAIVLTEDLIEVGSKGATVKVELQSNVSYEMIMPDLDWITESTTRSMSSYTHYFVVSENTEEVIREAEIVFVNEENGISESVVIRQNSKSAKLTGTWHLGWWVYGSNAIHFDGSEFITFGVGVMTWGGQQESGSNGEYQLEYADDYQSFIIRRTGVEKRFRIRYLTEKMLVFQEGDSTGPMRYWFTSKEDAKAASYDSLPEIIIDESEIPDPAHSEMDNINDILAIKQSITDSDITPMGRHFVGAHKTTDEDIAWLLDPENEPDYTLANANANSPTLTIWKEYPVNLYPFGSPEPADINQHAIGDCSLCAVMASVAYLYPDYIKEIIKDNGDGTYTVRLFDPDGKSVYVCVKSTFLCSNSGSFAQVTGKNNEVTWSTVLEKAIMKYETVYQVNQLYGIPAESAAPVITGDGRSFAYSPNYLWNGELKLVADWSVDEGMISIGGFTKSNLKCGSLYTVYAHAFTLMKTAHESEGYLFSMRNPWGIESVDGVLDIPDTRLVCSTIDFRLIYPGAAKPYLKSNRGAYVPPAWSTGAAELGVSRSLLQMTNCKTVKPSPMYK
ncbi:MAG: BACON domain-containing protein [Muribaculaceae bacterium]